MAATRRLSFSVREPSPSPVVPSSRHTLGVSQENLSQMLGTSRQSINKVLRDWERNGLIERHYGSISLCNLDALKRLSMPG
ncbi:helix-turn-helix domain-containing protein [Noviherbaspirillum sedimenti]|uniref:Helix-turn-helix domain-containing protein n=1 Tax=Noviherbaspirillum sedimenti TaxID=2320865 RepID=A0A3A3GQ92_9BURK|nr:helix-turn-helix domain-containing protein [Noviherbaspirillum sedimenti]